MAMIDIRALSKPAMSPGSTERAELLRELSVLLAEEVLYGKSASRSSTMQSVVGKLSGLQKMTALTEAVAKVQPEPARLPPPKPKKRAPTCGPDNELGYSLSQSEGDDSDEESDDETATVLDANGRPLVVDDDQVEYTSEDSLLDNDDDAVFTDDDDDDNSQEETDDNTDGDDDATNKVATVRQMLEHRTMCEIRIGYELGLRHTDPTLSKQMETYNKTLQKWSEALVRIVGNTLDVSNVQHLQEMNAESATRAAQILSQLAFGVDIERINMGPSLNGVSMSGSVTNTNIEGDVYQVKFSTNRTEPPTIVYENAKWSAFLMYMFDVMHLDLRVHSLLMTRIANVSGRSGDVAYRKILPHAWLERVKYLVNDEFVRELEDWLTHIVMYVHQFVREHTSAPELLPNRWKDDEDLMECLTLLKRTSHAASRSALLVQYKLEKATNTQDVWPTVIPPTQLPTDATSDRESVDDEDEQSQEEEVDSDATEEPVKNVDKKRTREERDDHKNVDHDDNDDKSDSMFTSKNAKRLRRMDKTLVDTNVVDFLELDNDKDE